MAKAKTEHDKLVEQVKASLARLPLTVWAKNTYRKDRSINFLHMFMSLASFSDAKTGEVAFELCMDIGGGSLIFKDHVREEEWVCGAKDLMDAFMDAREKMGNLPPLPDEQKSTREEKPKKKG